MLDNLVIEEVVCDTVSGHDYNIIVLHLVVVWGNLLLQILALATHAALVRAVEEVVFLLHRSEHLSYVGIAVLGTKEHIRRITQVQSVHRCRRIFKVAIA